MRSLFTPLASIVFGSFLAIQNSHAVEHQFSAPSTPFRGTPNQVKRVLEEIDTLRGESASESRTLLREINQYGKPTPGGRLGCEDLCFQRILATRRPLKVISELAGEPAESRPILLKAEMQLLADEYLRAAKVVVAWYDDPTKPKNNDVAFDALRFSACTLLYAAACHTDESTVASLLATWRQVSGRVQKVVDSSQKMPPFPRKLLVQWAVLSSEDTYNILRRCHDVSGGFEEVAKLPLPDSVKKLEIVVVPWKAAANNYDFAVQVQGAEVDRTHGFEVVHAFSFCAAANTTTARDEHLAFFNQLERLIDSSSE